MSDANPHANESRMRYFWSQICVPLVIGIIGSLIASHVYTIHQTHEHRTLLHKALLAELRGNLQSVGMAHFSPYPDEPHPASCEIRKDVFLAAMADPYFRTIAANEEPGRHDYFPGVYSALDTFVEDGKKPLSEQQYMELRSRCYKDIKQWLTPETIADGEAGLWFVLQ